MPRQRRASYFDRFGRELSEDEALDHNGTIRDGVTARTSLMMRDGINPALSALQRSVASRHQLSDQEAASCRPGFRHGPRSALDRKAMFDAKAEAYALYDAEIGRAYLTPEGFGGDPRVTGIGSPGPRQEPPAGSSCTKDGWPGVWRRGANGEMVCDISQARSDAKAQLRSRIDDPDADEDDDDDGCTVAQASADHQQRMARLYDALDSELRERWRTP
jgi:hypothetical protein